MNALLSQKRSAIAGAMGGFLMVAVASAQGPGQPSLPPASLTAVTAQVPVGDVVYVTDRKGATIKGTLAELTGDAIQVKVKDDVRHVAAADVSRIQWQQPDSALTGVLIGAGVGAIPGIYWLIADPNECTGMCSEDYAAIAVGAIVGGLIDHAIKKKVTVYSAVGSSGRTTSAVVGPLVMRDRKGVQVAVKF